jgi:hypothetical protein
MLRWSLANVCADLLALKSQHLSFRYLVVAGSILSLSMAALLFRQVSLVAALTSISLAFLCVVLVVWYWVEDSAHRRRLLLREANPSERDGINPDLRDEVALACAGLLVIVPVALFVMNDRWLGFQIAKDRFGIQAAICGDSADALCGIARDAFQLQAWLLFTVEHFVANAPFGGFLTTWLMPDSGVQKSGWGSSVALFGVQLLFGGLIFKLVISYFSKTQDQIKDAIDLFRVSPFMAAGLGPIAVASLVAEIERMDKSSEPQREKILSNAFEALLEIGQVYEYAVASLDGRTAAAVKARFDAMLVHANAAPNGEFSRGDLKTAASLVCLAGIETKIRVLVDEVKADRAGHYKRMQLIDALIENGRGERREMALLEIMNNDPWTEVANRVKRWRERVLVVNDIRSSAKAAAR